MQLDIFLMNSVPAQNHSPTSIAAAEKIYPRALVMREQLLQFLRGYPSGLTDDEMQRGLGWEGNTQRPRRRELEQAGRIKDSGKTRATSSGRQAVVWVAA